MSKPDLIAPSLLFVLSSASTAHEEELKIPDASAGVTPDDLLWRLDMAFDRLFSSDISFSRNL